MTPQPTREAADQEGERSLPVAAVGGTVGGKRAKTRRRVDRVTSAEQARVHAPHAMLPTGGRFTLP